MARVHDVRIETSDGRTVARGRMEFPDEFPAQPAPPPWASAPAYPGAPGVIVPPLAEPIAPPPLPPESPSVQMLRQLLAERRGVAGSAEMARDSNISQAEMYEGEAKRHREQADRNAVTIDAANDEIAEILANIETLGGRPETE